MQKNEKGSNVIKPNYCLSSKSAVGLFLFSFFEAKSLLEASHRLAANVCDWRSKSLALLLMVSTTLDGFYFANCVLAAVFFSFIFSTLQNNLKISLK